MNIPNTDTIIAQTRRWIAEVVIGLNLCPFARKPFASECIRFAVTPATTAAELREVLARELKHLVDTPTEQVETTILIHPHVLVDFFDYNDFAADANDLLAELGLDGVIQFATFHPEYRFADTAPDAVENFTNRSPFPMLHLLREASITAVANDPDELAGIPERNIETMRHLGRAKVLDLLRKVREG